MKKNLLLVAVAFAAIGMVACRSTKDEAAEAREKLNNLIVETHDPIKIEKKRERGSRFPRRHVHRAL